MQVISQEFKEHVLSQLNGLPLGAYLTREQLCEAAGADTEYSINISILLKKDDDFKAFKAVKSRGIGRKFPAPDEVKL